MAEVTRILEESPRKMGKRLQANPQTLSPTDASPQPGKKVNRRQSSAVLGKNSGRHRHHRVISYQALVQRPSTSMGNTRSNTSPTNPRSRSSYETVRPANHLHPKAFFNSTRRPSHTQRPKKGKKSVHGLQESIESGPRLQRSTSGLRFDNSSTEF